MSPPVRSAGLETTVTETSTKPLWRRLAPFWPVLVVLAVLMIGRSPTSASPGDPPAALRGAAFDLAFSPL